MTDARSGTGAWRQRVALSLASMAPGWWLLLPALAIWFLTQRYEGIYHDGELYTFQGLAHAFPTLFGSDLFLRYGSQDSYTIFSPLYGALIRLFGVETAAKLLTCSMQIGVLAAIGVFASSLKLRSGTALALFAIVCFPPVYGAGQHFHYLENFVSPRMGSEALSLLCVACWLRGWRAPALGLFVSAVALHPIIAMAPFAFIVWYELVRVRWTVAAAVCVLGALLLCALTLRSAWRFDAEWLAVTRESLPYLFILDWARNGYVQTALPLLALYAETLSPNPVVRRIAFATLAMALSALAASLLGADLLHLSLIIQGQPWRCLWLATLIAAALAPDTCSALWSRGFAGRCSVLLVVAAYLMSTPSALYVLIPLTFVAVEMCRGTLAPTLSARHQKLFVTGAWGLLGIGLLWNLAQKALHAKALFFSANYVGLDEKINDLVADGVLPVLLIFVCLTLWRAARATALRVIWILCAAAALIVCGILYAQSVRTVYYPAAVQAAFARWQALIPERAEVFIPEEPLLGWILLRRPGYFSAQQSVSGVFSRAAAFEGRRRAAAASAFLSPHRLQPWNDLLLTVDHVPSLDELCEATGVGFVVSRFEMHATPLSTMPQDAPAWLRNLQLYQCAPHDAHE